MLHSAMLRASAGHSSPNPGSGTLPSTLLPTGDYTTAAINFAQTTAITSPYFLGVCSSTYGANPLTNTTQSTNERKLDARLMRIPVRWNGSKVVSSAGGGGYNDILQLVDTYRSWDFMCLIVIAGRTNDFSGYVAGDATRIVEILGTNLLQYSTSNEPDNLGITEAAILAQSIQIYDDIQIAAPGTKLWGPVLASYKRAQNQRWAQSMGATRFAGIDYHHYGMGSTSLPTAQAMLETPSFASEVTDIRSDLTGLGLSPSVNVDELNFSWRYNDGTTLQNGGDGSGGNARFFTAINTVWLASALGHILESGGRGMPYALQNGPLGLLIENGQINPDNRPNNTPMPGYWGVAAWTGNSRFSHFNNSFYSTTLTNNPVDYIEVFAVNNEDAGYNMIVINKSETSSRNILLNLTSVAAGQFDCYQTRATQPYDQPEQVFTDATYTTYISLALPAMTVTTVVIRPRQ